LAKNLDDKVLERINLKKTVTLETICAEFAISESTCRRVFKRLHEKGLILRFHGGANSLDMKQESIGVYDRYYTKADLKEMIAKEAAKMVKPFETIFLMGGTTVFRMCKYIKDLQLKVITNSLLVFSELSMVKNIDLVLLGGTFNREESDFRGPLTTTNSKVFTCDHIFMGADGYISKAGFTTEDEGVIDLYRSSMMLAKKSYMLTDSSKFKNRGKAIIAPLTDVTDVFTDHLVPSEIVSELRGLSINVVVAQG
jgi:DeoR/GlpR family transcriptional regulator of sugar metabolism